MFQLIHCLAITIIAFAFTNAVLRGDDDKTGVTGKVEFRRAEIEPDEGLTEAINTSKKEKVFLHKKVELDNKDIASAHYEFIPQIKQHAVAITFTEDGAKKMGNLTKNMTGKRLAILLDGKVISVPIIEAELTKRAMISGLKKDDAEKLAKALNSK